LDGGINRWVTDGFETEWGSNVPSKDFGEKVEVVNHVPEIEAKELAERIAKGEKFVILDSRTPEEFRRFCIPGGRSVPGGELSLRITDIARKLDRDTTIIVNCAGRTRSIIGTRVLQRMGIPNVYGLKNGTAGWVLAGHKLETGADRVQLAPPSAEGVAAAEAYAAKLAAEDGVRSLDVAGLLDVIERGRQEVVYLIDVRTAEEYAAGHIPGFRWFPGGQAVQRSDDVAVVKNAPIVFACDGKARATLIASWYRQMGFREVYAVSGGTSAWTASGRSLERGVPDETPVGYREARGSEKAVSPAALHASPPPAIIFVDTSQDFARGHVPGARWVPRGWLELWIGDVVPSKSMPVTVTCLNDQSSMLAAVTLKELGYQHVSVLDGYALRDGAVDFVAGGAHTILLAFPNWSGAKLVVTLSQGTPWLLVLRADLPARRGDVGAVKGLRIGAAPGPDRAFMRLLHEAGIDPVRDGVSVAPVPGATARGASFGVLAAAALERGDVDGFWANALGSETAVRRGVGTIVVDVRRGDGPPDAGHYTFAALSTTDALIAREPERVAAVVRAIVRAQQILTKEPARATEVGRRRFPPAAADIIAAVVERDLPFYDPRIDER